MEIVIVYMRCRYRVGMLYLFYFALRGEYMKETIICKNCGKEFQDYVSNHRMFCCKECAYENKRNEANERKLRVCKNCGVEFSPKENRAKFCSLSCCHEYARKHSYTK